MSKRILIIVSNAHEIGPQRRRTGNFLPEVAHPYAEFIRAGCRVDFTSLTGETPFLDALHLADDPDNLAFLVGDGWASMQKAPKLSAADASGYDAIFIPGGLAPMVDMVEHALLKQVIRGTSERGAVVGAVCHGPVSLLHITLSNGTPLLAGKNVSAFTNDEERGYARADVPFELETALTAQGAIFHKTAPWAAFSIADGNLVTGQNPASAKGVAEKCWLCSTLATAAASEPRPALAHHAAECGVSRPAAAPRPWLRVRVGSRACACLAAPSTPSKARSRPIRCR